MVRFKADNPGVWPFHCHITWHFVMGMQVIFIESPDKIPAPSSDIPVCGDVTPQMFADKQKSEETSASHDQDDSKKSTIFLIFLIIGWVLFVVIVFLLIVLISKMRQMTEDKASKSNNVVMT